MDDYSLVSLSDSRNEWCARLVNTLTPCVIEGLKSIFDEAWKLCVENDEEDKYLMTFQTFLSRIPKWNPEIIETERKRIEDTSSCGYLEDLITCVHVIQLKALTCVRVGQQQKKVEIDIPSVNTFIHKIYCNVARKLYTSIYLFEKNLMPLEIQKHNRELEVIIRECILNTVRDTMPIENILRAYMDETEELDVNEEVVVIDEPEKKEPEPDIQPIAVTVEDTNNASPVTEKAVKKLDEVSIQPDKPIVTSSLPSPKKLEPIVSIPNITASSPAVESLDKLSIVDLAAPKDIPKPVVVAEPVVPDPLPNQDKVNFKDVDNAIDVNGNKSDIIAPKTDERLEEIANLSAERRKREEEEEEEEEKIKIGDSVSLDIMDVNDLNKPMAIESSPILNDIEVLS